MFHFSFEVGTSYKWVQNYKKRNFINYDRIIKKFKSTQKNLFKMSFDSWAVWPVGLSKKLPNVYKKVAQNSPRDFPLENERF